MKRLSSSIRNLLSVYCGLAACRNNGALTIACVPSAPCQPDRERFWPRALAWMPAKSLNNYRAAARNTGQVANGGQSLKRTGVRVPSTPSHVKRMGVRVSRTPARVGGMDERVPQSRRCAFGVSPRSGQRAFDDLARRDLRGDRRRVDADRCEHGLAVGAQAVEGADVAAGGAFAARRVDGEGAVIHHRAELRRSDSADDAALERLADRDRDLMIRVVLAAVGVALAEGAAEDV